MNPTTRSILAGLGFDLDEYDLLRRTDASVHSLYVRLLAEVAGFTEEESTIIRRLDLHSLDLLHLILTRAKGTIDAPQNLAAEYSGGEWSYSHDAVDDATGYRYRLNGGAWVDNASTSATGLTGQIAGENTVQVRAVDIYGRPGKIATYTFLVDNSVPDNAVLNEDESISTNEDGTILVNDEPV